MNLSKEFLELANIEHTPLIYYIKYDHLYDENSKFGVFTSVKINGKVYLGWSCYNYSAELLDFNKELGKTIAINRAIKYSLNGLILKYVVSPKYLDGYFGGAILVETLDGSDNIKRILPYTFQDDDVKEQLLKFIDRSVKYYKQSIANLIIKED